MQLRSRVCASIMFAALCVALPACSGGGSATPPSAPQPPAPPPPPPPPPPSPPPTSSSVTISGSITFERVPFNTVTNGLNFNASQPMPARSVVVEALNAAGGVIASGVSNSSGGYTLSVPSNTDVRIQARAQLRDATSSQYDFTVRDNTNGNAVYVLAGSLVSSGAANSTRNLFAPSGWGGSSYTSTRAAAPFALLDTAFTAILQILAAEPATTFTTGQFFWSVNNRPADGDISAGEIGTSSYTRISGVPTILILGAENTDTDEFDAPVVAHEFGHYVEDVLARSDSIGGAHSLGQRLDMRVAMSEGWGNAFSATVLGDPIYRDSSGAQQSTGFNFNLEANGVGMRGWYSEASVQSIIFDLADSAVDGPDSISGGLPLIYRSLIAPTYANTPAPTSIYAYLEAARSTAGASAAAVDALRLAQNIFSTSIFGDGETNDGAIPTSLPVVRPLTIGAAPVMICSVDDAGIQNNLGNHVFLRFSLSAQQNIAFSMTRISGPTGRDPDFFIFSRGNLVVVAGSAAVDSETTTRTLAAGDYFIDAFDFLNVDEAGPSGDVCFNFSAV